MNRSIKMRPGETTGFGCEARNLAGNKMVGLADNPSSQVTTKVEPSPSSSDRFLYTPAGLLCLYHPSFYCIQVGRISENVWVSSFCDPRVSFLLYFESFSETTLLNLLGWKSVSANLILSYLLITINCEHSKDDDSVSVFS